MKAPDTIYIPENLSNSDKIRLSSVDEKGRGIPYIRKDALLEWAKEQWLHTRNGTMADQIRSSAYEEMIKHIKSL